MLHIRHFFLLSFIACVVFLPGISKLPVIDRDEAHFAQTSRQMLQTHRFFEVHFQDTARFRKPPGINWLQAGAVRLFSNAEVSDIWPYRLPSFLGALFSILLTYYFTRRLINPDCALLASALLASSLLLSVEAHMAVIDASLLLAVIAMQGALWVIYENEAKQISTHWFWSALFWIALTYGALLKGLTPLIAFLTVSMLCVYRGWCWLTVLKPGRGIFFFSLVTLAWLLLLNQAEHSNYLWQMLSRDLLPKLQSGHESHGKPPLFHLILLPLTFWPASLFLWFAANYTWQARRQFSVQFLLSWIIPTWIFFEFMPTKLPQYVLPTFPAISILCALGLQHVQRSTKFLKILQSLWLVLSLGLCFFIAFISYLIHHEINFSDLFLVLGTTLGSVAAMHFAWQQQLKASVIATLSLALFAYPLIFYSYLPALQPIWMSQSIAEKVASEVINADNPLMAIGFDEPSLVFYLNTYHFRLSDDQQIKQSLQTHPNQLALLEAKHFHQWTDEAHFKITNEIHGFNYSKGRWIDLVLIQIKRGELQDVTI